MKLEEALLEYGNVPMTTEVILEHLDSYRRPYDKLGELTRKGTLVQLKRGLYIAGPSRFTQGAHDFLIANHLVSPSYISLESALAFWGLIPERVYGVSSVTPLRSTAMTVREVKFDYTHVPLKGFALGYESQNIGPNQTVLIASAEKALCDYVACRAGLNIRSMRNAEALLIEDLRIDDSALRSLRAGEIENWIPYLPKQGSMALIVKYLKSLG
jgi:predicted transcriptional regulator of viral defense system